MRFAHAEGGDVHHLRAHAQSDVARVLFLVVAVGLMFGSATFTAIALFGIVPSPPLPEGVRRDGIAVAAGR